MRFPLTHSLPLMFQSKFCDKLDAATHKFWWNLKRDQGRFLAWKPWEHLCLPKSSGGLGFRKSKMFNDALIAKLTWMVVTKRDNLCINALISKYKVDDEWMYKECKHSASQTWNAMHWQDEKFDFQGCLLSVGYEFYCKTFWFLMSKYIWLFIIDVYRCMFYFRLFIRIIMFFLLLREIIHNFN